MFHRSSHTQRSSCETPVGNNYKPFSGGHPLQRNKDEVAKRPTGALQNGNGTIIYYKEDGTVREVKTYLNGIEK